MAQAASDIRVAAFDLGASSVGFRYGACYYWRYWRQELGEDGAGIMELELQRLDTALTVLAAEINPTVESRLVKVLRELPDFARDLERAGSTGDYRGRPFNSGNCPGRAQWQKLMVLSGQAVRFSPRLAPWQELGESLVFCLLSFVENDPPETPLPITKLNAAIQALPTNILKKIPVLQSLAQKAVPAEISKLTRRLRRALDRGTRHIEVRRAAPESVLVRFLAAAIDRVRKDMHSLDPTHELRIDVSGPEAFAVLDGRPYPLNEPQMLILKSLLHARGGFMSSEDIVAQHHNLLRGVRIDREIKALPELLHELIQSKKSKGGGYQLFLG